MTNRRSDLPLGQVLVGDCIELLETLPPACVDLVFADPPYDLVSIPDIPGWIFDNGVLDREGLLILEHSGKHNFRTHPNFRRTRKYGSVNFSFFEMEGQI